MRYKALAPAYDRLMNHVEYDEWALLISKILEKYSSAKKPAVFELGGGTALLAEYLKNQDISYIGSDLSFSMCRQAHKKSIPFFCCDCRNIAVKKKFDLIFFLYDGINYLMSLQDYSQLFQEVHKCLQENGLFLFDITTETNSLKHFYDYFDFEDFGDIFLTRHSYYDEKISTQFNEFTIFQQCRDDKDLFRKFHEIHVQKLFPAKSIEELVHGSRFKILGIWNNFSFKRYSSKSERIHFLLQKSG